jgi:hypothetical protein
VLLAATIILPIILIGFSMLFWIQYGSEGFAPIDLLVMTVIGLLIFRGGLSIARWMGRQKPVTLHDLRKIQASEDSDERE